MRRFSLVAATLLVCLIARPASAKIVHRWSFDKDGKDGTDSVGGVAAKLNDGAATKEGKVVLDGQNNWVDLPIGKTMEKLKSITVETWVTWDEQQGAWCRIFDFGQNTTINMFLTPRNGGAANGSEVNTPRLAITTGGFGEEEQLNAGDEFPVGKLTHVVITIDGDKKEGKFYINGKEVAKSEITVKPSDLGNTTNNFVGASQYTETDPLFHGSISEFRIYDSALSAAEVEANNKLGPDKLGEAAPAAAPMRPAATSDKAGDKAAASDKAAGDKAAADKDK
jgi:hypothetical protein